MFVDEFILVDDASVDKTIEKARTLGISVIMHSENRGYGGNQKTCYKEALRRGADIIVMIHPDYQYDGRYLPYMVGPIKDKLCDVMLGSRITSRREVIRGGMPLYKYIANRFLTFIENIVLGLSLSEFHTGYRAYSRQFIELIPFIDNSEDFVFDSEVLIQAAYFKFKIGEIFVPTRYFEESSKINFFRSIVYGINTLVALGKYILAKSGIYHSKIFRKCQEIR